jgi:hypothetical protein
MGVIEVKRPAKQLQDLAADGLGRLSVDIWQVGGGFSNL